MKVGDGGFGILAEQGRETGTDQKVPGTKGSRGRGREEGTKDAPSWENPEAQVWKGQGWSHPSSHSMFEAPPIPSQSERWP